MGESRLLTSSNSTWRAGDWAVYRKSKHSRVPGPRAARVQPAAKGDSYNYVVDKFWVVEEVLPEGRLLLRTARGKQHSIEVADPNLRRPNLIQRVMFRYRFQSAEAGATGVAA